LSSDGKKILVTNRILLKTLDPDNYASQTAMKLQPHLGEEANIENTEYFRNLKPAGLNKQIEKYDMEEKFRQ
jgi:hypothetical protein